jgi:Biotin protein ligase C terminal domain
MRTVTAEPRRIEADMDAAETLHRRTQLGWMVEDGQRVRVTNPSGETWTGRIVGLADHPAMLLERDDGCRVMLPQCFAVEQVRDEDHA